MVVQACTIVSRAYVPHARVLARSFAEHHPDGAFWALLIDDLDQEIVDQDEPFRVLRLDDLDVDLVELHRMAMLFGSRLIAAIKPWVFEHFIRNGFDSIIYIDSDFQVFDSLQSVADGASEHGVLVVPHVIDPVPRDGRQPDETRILGVGTFNAGFFAVGRAGGDFVDFLKERLRRECHTDVRGMRVNEQRWLDFVPALFNHLVLRDPGVDAAPWNLHERPLTRDGNRYLAAGLPLRAFHYSGFDPRIPEVLSARDYWDKPRVPMSESPALLELCRSYASALNAAGFEHHHHIPFAFDFLPDGTPVYASLRHLYRDKLLDAEANGGFEPPDPFDLSEIDEFRQWAVGAFAAAGQRPPERLTQRDMAQTMAEDWIGRMQVGDAGLRTDSGAVHFTQECVGDVLAGPNALLDVGRYRATVDVWLGNRSTSDVSDAHMLVIEAMSDGYALGCTAVSRSGGTAAMVEFVVPPRMQRTGLSVGVQLRIQTREEVAGSIQAVLVERLGGVDEQSMAGMTTEWLPAMSVGDVGERTESEVVKRSDLAGFMAEGPRWRLDGGRYRAELGIHTIPDADEGRADGGSTVMGLVEAVVHGYVLAHRAVTADDLAAGLAVLEFDLMGRWAKDRYTRVELKIRAQTDMVAVLDTVRVRRIGDVGSSAAVAQSDWLPALWVGDSAIRVGATIHSARGKAGLLAHGPGWRLDPGRYRFDVVIEAREDESDHIESLKGVHVRVLSDATEIGERLVVLRVPQSRGSILDTCSIEFEVRARTVPPPLLELTPLIEIQISTEGRGQIVIRSANLSREDRPT